MTTKVGDIQGVMVHYRVDESTARRALALAPASALLPKSLASTAADGVPIPTWLFFLGLGFGFGLVMGPAVMTSTESGARRLAEMAKRRIG